MKPVSPNSLEKKRSRPLFITLVTVIFSLSAIFYVFMVPTFGSTFSNWPLAIVRANRGRRPEDQSKQKLPFAVGESKRGCNIFSGRWVWDNLTRPLYEESECPYLTPQQTCQKHGRPDKDYLYWRWQPHDCSVPSFNATFMLEKLRDKRLMFVGDSLSRGAFFSMICLLNPAIPQHAKSFKGQGQELIFKDQEHNATIEFYWTPFLLESNADDADSHRVSYRLIRKDSIDKHGIHWRGVDIIIFNSYLWWMDPRNLHLMQGSFDDEVKNIQQLPVEEAYRKMMRSMLKWVKENMDPTKTRVFFTTMSPIHSLAEEWGGDKKGRCYNETTIIENPDYWGGYCSKDIMKVIEEEVSESEVPITLLNITQLSLYRKDAHTSIYKRPWSPLTSEQLANPVSYADCIHWCSPGLQDTWNELLFVKIFYP